MEQGGNCPSGFTIVETLIVLAVTGALVISALLLIGGKQNKTQFLTSFQETQQQLQQISNEVSSGYFPNNNDYSCTANAPNTPVIDTTIHHNQGTNAGCIFLGKIIHFGIPSGGGSRQFYYVYVMAGNRLDQRGDEVSSLYNDGSGNGGAEPVVAAPSVEKTVITLHNGLTLQKMYYNGSTANTIGAFGYMSSLASYDVSGGTGLSSGSQATGLYAVSGSTLTPADDNAAVDEVNGSPTLPYAPTMANGPIIPVNSVTLCFNSGSTNEFGQITVGGTGQQLSINTHVGYGTC